MSEYAKGSPKHAGGGGHSDPSNYHSDPHLRSFLFLINELKIQEDDGLHRGDDWYNRLPPTNPNEFAGEIPGTVMRCQNGRVAEAPGYQWFREDFNGTAWPPGYVWTYNSDESHMHTGEETVQCATIYKQLAVFSCNPLLPIVVFNGDPLSAARLPRSPLLFFHPPSQPGISHAVHPDSPMEPGPGLCKYVAGTNPSWMPSLVPTTYSNPYDAGPSTGLAGELPIILGLMAFSESINPEGDAVTQTFLGDGAHRGKWRDGQWHRREAPRGYPLSTAENPRGFLVTVFYDPENQINSNDYSLWEMQWKEPIVRERR